MIGVPDEAAGELPKAFVVVQPGAELTEDEVKAYVAEHMASYKHVRIVEFTDEIPKSPSGKILRRFLRDRGLSLTRPHTAVALTRIRGWWTGI